MNKPSKKQIQIMKELKIQYNENTTSAEAYELIGKAIKKWKYEQEWNERHRSPAVEAFLKWK